MGISGPRGVRGAFVVGTVLASLWASSAFAVNVNFVSGAVGADIEVYKDAGEALGGEDRQHGHLRPDALLDHRPVRPVQAVARGREQGHRRLHRRRDLGAAALRPVPRPDAGLLRRGQGPLPLDRREPDRRRQARRAALLHRRAGALLPQGPARQVRREGARDLGGADRHRPESPGGRARRRQEGPLGLRLPGRRLRGPDLQRARMDQVARRRPDHRAGRHDLGQQRERGEGARAGGRLDQHHLAAGRPLLHRGGEPRRLADRQRRLHAQLALRLRARQRRRQPDQGPLRRGAPALGRRGQQVGGDARRLEPRGVEVLAEPRGRDRPRDVHGLVRVPEAGGAEAQPPADDPGALRRRRHRRDSSR